ncbi:MAG: hypothetical protein ACKV2O_07710, partial [Acidimicrobiales bacterium]
MRRRTWHVPLVVAYLSACVSDPAPSPIEESATPTTAGAPIVTQDGGTAAPPQTDAPDPSTPTTLAADGRRLLTCGFGP